MYKLTCDACYHQNQIIYMLSVPPVVALSMKQGLCITVQGLDWVVFIVPLLCVIKRHTEGCLLNSVQSLLVLTTAKEGFTCFGPGGPTECQRQT